MEGCCRILNVDIIPPLEICHHTFREPHIKVGFDRIIYITLVKVRISKDELHLEFVNEFIYLLIAAALPRRALFPTFLYLNLDLRVILI
jgi:hypothetical protein